MTKFISKNGGLWSDASCWRGGVVPTAEDDVVGNDKSGMVIIDSTAICRSIDLSEFASTIQVQFETDRGPDIVLLRNEQEVMDYINSNIQ